MNGKVTAKKKYSNSFEIALLKITKMQQVKTNRIITKFKISMNKEYILCIFSVFKIYKLALKEHSQR